MINLDQIKAPVKSELREFEKHFRNSLKSNVSLLDIITNFILRRKGKQIRPTFVFLTSGMLGDINSSTYTAASLIELLHTASLIHDDVVDESYERRGFFSLKALWRSKVAVLVGDFLLARGLILSVQNKEYQLLEIVSEAVSQMSEGELMQIRKSRKLNISMDEYFDIVQKKTAALIGACTACGARAAGSDDEVVDQMKEFGLYCGIAFQIKDDLFDYDRNGKIGKPTANDIQEKKMTLPLIYALQNCPSNEKKKIIALIKKEKKSSKQVDQILDFVESYKGLEFAEERMNEYRIKAIQILNTFPSNAFSKSLIDLVDFTVNRKK